MDELAPRSGFQEITAAYVRALAPKELDVAIEGMLNRAIMHAHRELAGTEHKLFEVHLHELLGGGYSAIWTTAIVAGGIVFRHPHKTAKCPRGENYRLIARLAPRP